MNQPIPLSDPKRRFEKYRTSIEQAWRKALDSGIYIGGPGVTAFETAFAEFCGARQCVALANGTDALELALRALGVEAGDEVITVANAGGYTTTACLAIGAIPVYVDVERKTAQIDVTDVTRAVTALTRA